jgi:hypothetical protein
MKKQLLLILFALGTIFNASAISDIDLVRNRIGLFQNKYYKDNVWDVQRSPSYPTTDGIWKLTYFSDPYDALTNSDIDWGRNGDRYLMFNIVEADDFDPIRYKRYEDDIYRTGDYLLVLNLYESDGSFVKPVCNFSVIYGFGEVGFMAEVEGRFGTLFTNQGFSTGDKVEYITTVASTSKLSELSDYLYAPITTKSIAKPSPSVLTFTYDGFGHAPNIPENDAYGIKGQIIAQSAGSYSTTVYLKDITKARWDDGTTDDIIIYWSITKATYNMSSAKWNYTTAFAYDDTQKTVTVTGLPAGVTVSSYSGNTATNAGTYTARATLSYDANNYYTPSITDLSWTILKGDHDMSSASWSYTVPIAYDGTEKTVSVTGLPQGVTVSSYTGNSATVVGDYIASAVLSYDATNYNAPTIADLNWSITKGTYNMSTASWNYTSPFTWDNTEKTVTVTGLPAGVTAISYTGNKATLPGDYTAKVVLSYDAENYNAPLFGDLNWSIIADFPDLSIIQLWDNVLAVSNSGKHKDITDAEIRWYRDGQTLSQQGQYIYFNDNIPVGNYSADIIIGGDVILTLTYDVATKAQAVAYPNPVRSGSTVTVDLGEPRPDNERAEVVSLAGFPVNVYVAKQGSSYMISGLNAPGTYFVRVFTADKTVSTLKVVVR